jgi:hypothetical protein
MKIKKQGFDSPGTIVWFLIVLDEWLRSPAKNEEPIKEILKKGVVLRSWDSLTISQVSKHLCVEGSRERSQ